MGGNRLYEKSEKKGYKAYQLNLVKVKHEKGKAVKTINSVEDEKLKNLYIWHFIWSKFYYFKKHYGFFLASLYFFPIIIRIFFRLIIYKNNNGNKFKKYYCRWDGLKNSILGNKSHMRLDKL